MCICFILCLPFFFFLSTAPVCSSLNFINIYLVLYCFCLFLTFSRVFFAGSDSNISVYQSYLAFVSIVSFYSDKDCTPKRLITFTCRHYYFRHLNYASVASLLAVLSSGFLISIRFKSNSSTLNIKHTIEREGAANGFQVQG